MQFLSDNNFFYTEQRIKKFALKIYNSIRKIYNLYMFCESIVNP